MWKLKGDKYVQIGTDAHWVPALVEETILSPLWWGEKGQDACFVLPADVGIISILLELLKPKVAYFYRKWYSLQF